MGILELAETGVNVDDKSWLWVQGKKAFKKSSVCLFIFFVIPFFIFFFVLHVHVPVQKIKPEVLLIGAISQIDQKVKVCKAWIPFIDVDFILNLLDLPVSNKVLFSEGLTKFFNEFQRLDKTLFVVIVSELLF